MYLTAALPAPEPVIPCRFGCAGNMPRTKGMAGAPNPDVQRATEPRAKGWVTSCSP